MILDYRYRLEILLGGAVTTNQLDWTVDFQDINLAGEMSKPTVGLGVTNNTTAVSLVAAPGTVGFIRRVTRISVHNKDTVNATVTIQYNVAAGGGTAYIVQKYTLATLTSLHFGMDGRWFVL